MKITTVLAAVSRKAGGLQNSVRRLSQCVYSFPDVEQKIVSLLDEFAREDVAEWAPLPVKTFPVIGPRAFGYSPGLKAELLADDADLMHTHGLWQFPSVAVEKWHCRTGKPYIVSPHGMLDPWAVKNSAWKKRLALFLYERKHLENAACIRALCESEAHSIRAFDLKNPICIIPNGIDLPVFGNAENLKAETLKYQSNESASSIHDSISACQRVSVSAFAGGRKVLLYLGRIHPKKGLVNLLRAWKQTLNSQPSTNDWLLAIAGWDQGGHEAELKSLATELGIAWQDCRAQSTSPLRLDRGEGQGEVSSPSAIFHLPSSPASSLLFLGSQFNEAKAACYRDCDAFILPSFSEGLPMVVLEAWAHGKPVLMTPECNLPEGFAANAAFRIETNVESIAQGLEDLLRRPSSDLRSLGDNGHTLVQERFTWPKIASEIKLVYEWVLGGGAKPECVTES